VVKNKITFCLGIQIWMLCFFCANLFAHIDINIPDANVMLASDPNIILVDVRELSSYCTYPIGHVPGALCYPWNSDYFEEHYTDFDINDIIFIICYSGGRSNSAANFLDGEGYNYVYDILGGTGDWYFDYGYTTVGCVDFDEDGLNDDLDNCPLVYNPAQADSDGDYIGNCCDDNFPYLDGFDPVDFFDLAILALDWMDTGINLVGDLDGDDTVNEKDLQILSQFWLKDCDEE